MLLARALDGDGVVARHRLVEALAGVRAEIVVAARAALEVTLTRLSLPFHTNSVPVPNSTP